MTLIDELRTAWSVMFFSQKAITDVAKRSETTQYALWFLTASSMFVFFLTIFSPQSVIKSENIPILTAVIVAIIGSVLFAFIISSILHGVALLFKGTGKVLGLFRVFGYVTFVSVIQSALAYLSYVPYAKLLTIQLLKSMPFTVIDIVFLVYAMVFYTYAISVLESVQKWKATLIWIIPLLIFSGLYALLLLALAALTSPVFSPIA